MLFFASFFASLCLSSQKTEIRMEWSDTSFLWFLYWLYWIVALFIMTRVVLRNRDTVKTLAWIMVFVFMPFLGLLLYFFFGRDTRKKRMAGKRLISQIKQRSSLKIGGRVDGGVQSEYQSLVTFFENASSASLLSFDSAEVISDTQLFYERLFEIISAAEDHIHLQFYIVEDDEFGHRLRDVLVAKAKQGVEVRMIYDSVGCWRVDSGFFESLRCAGVYVESFLKVFFPLLSNRVNYRNHRKVVVVDGKVGLVGGCNVADRYLKGVNGGCWRDTMLLLRGAAVNGLQTSFVVDWYFANGTQISGKRYFPLVDVGRGPYAQIVTSNPVGDVRAIVAGYIKVLSLAKGFVYMQTPYFMPDEAFLQALKCASMSGVDVRLMIPEKSDSTIADYASMSYLGDLLESGVKVFLYRGGMLHCKSVVCDDYLSSIGSTNLDFRSFFYNFEVGAFVYDKAVALDVKEAFLNDLKQCRQLTASEYRKRSFFKRCAESFVKLFSPLL